MALAQEPGHGWWCEPTRPVVTVRSWMAYWFSMLDVGEWTEELYRSVYRCHIEPRWGGESLGGIVSSAVQVWLKELGSAGYASGTVEGIRWLLSRVLADAVDMDVIEANPVRCGRRTVDRTREFVWASPEEALMVAANAASVSTTGNGLMIVTAAWTGMRWGELAGLHREKVYLDDGEGGRLRVDAELGALHESAHRVWLGPPLTAVSVRWVSLPPFLAELLRQHLGGHDAPMVFPTAAGSWQRRSNFSRQVMRPAADGTDGITGTANARAGQPCLPAVKPGLGFRGLRHSHQAWLIEDGVPEIVRAARLGHALGAGIRQLHVHVAPGWEQQMLDRLQARFVVASASASPRVRAFLGAAVGDPTRAWRDAA